MGATINKSLLEKLARGLFDTPERREQFVEALCAGNVSEKAVLWLSQRPAEVPFSVLPPAPWQPEFVDRVDPKERPGSFSLHEAGAYYCLDLSSVFAASALRVLGAEHRQKLVMDTCAAPGGKSVFAWRELNPSLLFCNEVIGKRTAALISNLTRCKIKPSRVTRSDTSKLAAAAPNAFPVVIVDAPCSGQSLIAKGDDSPGCFHPSAINMNSNRQKRIVANSASLVSAGGILAYMTCTYSRQENEAVIEWLRKKFPSLSPIEVPHLHAHQSTLADFPCYRLWPHEGLGAGAFVALLRDNSDDEGDPTSVEALMAVWQQ